MNGISVIVCCYNSATRIEPTLLALSEQSLLREVTLEIIIVDNNSNDRTSELVLQLWEKFGSPFKLKVVTELTPGLSNARLKGIETSNFDILLFCDDDNWLKETYVAEGIKHFMRYPELALVGGRGIPIFEKEEPEWFQTFKVNFAVGSPVERKGFLTDNHHYLYGAGLFLRKSYFESLIGRGFKFQLSDRKGKALSSGGDQELVFAMRLVGYKAYFDDELTFYHFMPHLRMNWDYLKRLRRGMYESSFIIYLYRSCLTPELWNSNFIKSIKSVLIIIYYGVKWVFANKCDKLFLKTKIHLILKILTQRRRGKEIRKGLLALRETQYAI